jgi:lactobin A/cerein 7B family class IIb bacteriocin
MKKLNLEQMEDVNGGKLLQALGCGFASIALVGAFAALVTATGGAALAIAAVTYSISPAAWGLACFA